MPAKRSGERRLAAIVVVSGVAVCIWFCQIILLTRHIPTIRPSLSQRSKYSLGVSPQWRHLLYREPVVTTQNPKDSPKVNSYSERRNDWTNFSKIQLNEDIDTHNVLTIDCTHRKLAVFSEDILCKKQKIFSKKFKNPCWYDELEGKVRCLPYFHLFGTCKSGTTDLFHRITQHPHILKNRGILGKETWFWSWRRYGNGRMPGGTMYLSQFSKLFDSETISQKYLTRSDESTYHHLITGHGEPMDFWDQSFWRLIPQNDPEGAEPNITTPYLIKYVNPSIKLILILRNPVDRLYSHYLHGYYGNNTDQFHLDVVQTIRDLRGCQRSHTLRACLYDNNKTFKVPLSASIYHVHLKEWLKVFSRRQILIIRSEDYRANISQTLQDVFSFLGVESLPTTDLNRLSQIPAQHPTAGRSTSGPIRPDTKAILTRFLRHSILQLANILQDQRYLDWL
ncbi:carbohydrate sulfotransferase 15-like [Argopecten irradians]|uniref:carbohydrate sulfotransferase 15-like n=1 Tax=Argopecten irradians TaxID=31199 RepID=UPI0037246701